MKEYKAYWKKDGRKRNITWEAKLARYLEHHTPLERIRHELFKAFDEGKVRKSSVDSIRNFLKNKLNN